MNWWTKLKVASFEYLNHGQPDQLVGTRLSGDLRTTFSYQDDEGYSEYDLLPMASASTGGETPSHLAVIRKTPMKGPLDAQIDASIKRVLRTYHQTQFSDGESPITNALGKAQGTNYSSDPDKIIMNENLPEEKKTRPIPKGMSVSKPSAHGTIIIGPVNGDILGVIKQLVKQFEAIVKPMIEKNLLSFYSVDGGAGHVHVKSQQAGNAFADEMAVRCYFKHVSNTVMERYPALKVYWDWRMHTNFHDAFCKANPTKKYDLRNDERLRKTFDFYEYSNTDRTIFNAIVNFDERTLAKWERFMEIGQSLKLYGHSVIQYVELLNNHESMDKLLQGQTVLGSSLVTPKLVAFAKEAGYEEYANQLQRLLGGRR